MAQNWRDDFAFGISNKPPILSSSTLENVGLLRSSQAEILAGIRFTEPLIRSLFREEIMKESVIYQSIHRQAREEGLQEGLQQGLQDEALRLVLRQLTIVLGEIAPESKAQIEALSQERLENLAEALLAFKSQKDLENWLLVLGS
jgi:hypothetical protein